MASDLQKQLQPASFRGVPFEVEAGDFQGGRRGVVHEYPQRDKAQPEDLGRATRRFPMRAFVVGPDYIQRANALISALERGGVGTLVHPWLGSMQVEIIGEFRVSYDARSHGQALFDIPFVESGEQAFPAAVVSTQAQSRTAADKLQTAAVKSYNDEFTVKGVPDFAVAASVAHWQTALDVLKSPLPGTEVLGYANKLADLAVGLESTIANPGLLPGRLVSALGLSSLANTVQRWDRIIPGLLRLVRSGRVAPARTMAKSDSQRVVVGNVNATSDLVRRAVLSQAVGASSVMSMTEHDTAVAVRDALCAALDDEMLAAQSDAAYRALIEARNAVWTDMTRRSRNAARLKTWRPLRVEPALVAAHELYGDATRADEIVQRNAVRRPGFLSPAADLMVLAS